LDVTAIPERAEMRVPAVGERKNEILQVAVVRSTDDQVAPGPKKLLCELRKMEGSHQMLDDLGCDRHVKAVVTNDRRIVVHAQLVEYQFRRSTLCEVKALGARFASDDFVSAAGKLAA